MWYTEYITDSMFIVGIWIVSTVKKWVLEIFDWFQFLGQKFGKNEKLQYFSHFTGGQLWKSYNVVNFLIRSILIITETDASLLIIVFCFWDSNTNLHFPYNRHI